MGFREERVKAGITVLEAAKSLGVSDAAVYQWETGVYTPSAKRLPVIANLYGCTVDDLLKEDAE